MSLRMLAGVAALLCAAALPAGPVQAQELAGVYVSESSETRVNFAPCGGSICGRIISVTGETKDVHNADASKKGRALVGVTMVTMSKAGAGAYTGQLYNYKDGKTYSGKASISGKSLTLSGCMLGGIICRGQTWTKAN